MYSLTIVHGGASWRFMFRAKSDVDKFRGFRAAAAAQDLIIDDDFGQHAEIRTSDISGIQIEDMEQSRLAHMEGMVWNARIQQGAQERLRTRAGIAQVPSLNPIELTRRDAG